ncbi:MAG: hypothetical protein JSS11_03645 [Verrucomicrobia bacterium]|nr:hypothetical protein [Verrucomicrobiota bacterium]
MSAHTPAPTPAPIVLTEVRYSLPEMLREIQVERAASSFTMEKLDQMEIGKLFKTKSTRRAKSKK